MSSSVTDRQADTQTRKLHSCFQKWVGSNQWHAQGSSILMSHNIMMSRSLLSYHSHFLESWSSWSLWALISAVGAPLQLVPRLVPRTSVLVCNILDTLLGPTAEEVETTELQETNVKTGLCRRNKNCAKAENSCWVFGSSCKIPCSIKEKPKIML